MNGRTPTTRATLETWRTLAPPAEFTAKSIPEIRSEEVPDCPICGSRQFTDFAVGFDYELLTCANPWRLAQCDSCRHVWLNPRPAESELKVIYPPSYYSYTYEDSVHPIALRGKQLLDRLKLQGILAALGRLPQRYLDVGCGSGRFLRALEARGVARDHLFGLELDPKVVDQLKQQGYQVFCQTVEQCEALPADQLDLITMYHVIEHVSDPLAVVKKLSRWLAPDGVLALETPNLDSVDARAFSESFWGGYHIPRHWNLFTPESIQRLLEQAGFEIIAIRYQTGHSFWLYSLHHRLRYGASPHPRLARWFDPFGGFLPFLVLFTGLDKLRAMLRFRTSAMLVLARKRPAVASAPT